MLVRCVAAAVHNQALLVERELLVDAVAVALNVAVQIRDGPGDDVALGVVPRAEADTIARVHRRLFYFMGLN